MSLREKKYSVYGQKEGEGIMCTCERGSPVRKKPKTRGKKVVNWILDKIMLLWALLILVTIILGILPFNLFENKILIAGLITTGVIYFLGSFAIVFLNE